jgi:hypothetical protein
MINILNNSEFSINTLIKPALDDECDDDSHIFEGVLDNEKYYSGSKTTWEVTDNGGFFSL